MKEHLLQGDVCLLKAILMHISSENFNTKFPQPIKTGGGDREKKRLRHSFCKIMEFVLWLVTEDSSNKN